MSEIERSEDDPNKAHEMALQEDLYHKKILGIIPPSKKRIKKGQKVAEEFVQEQGYEISYQDLPKGVMEEVNRGINHKIWGVAGSESVDSIRKWDREDASFYRVALKPLGLWDHTIDIDIKVQKDGTIKRIAGPR